MEIQWVILAMKCINIKGFLNITGIFHRINLDKGNQIFNFQLIAKINYEPQHAFEKKLLRLEIIYNNETKSFEIPYQLPDLEVWSEYNPYVIIPIRNLLINKEGDYIFRLTVDGESKSEELIKVGHYGG